MMRHSIKGKSDLGIDSEVLDSSYAGYPCISVALYFISITHHQGNRERCCLWSGCVVVAQHDQRVDSLISMIVGKIKNKNVAFDQNADRKYVISRTECDGEAVMDMKWAGWSTGWW